MYSATNAFKYVQKHSFRYSSSIFYIHYDKITVFIVKLYKTINKLTS